MTKQELIKQQWKCISNVKYDKNNGWAISYCVNGIADFDEDILKKIEYQYLEDDLINWRPKSLKGIDDNNGWVKIETKDDLPNNGEFYVYSEKYKTKEPAYFDGEQFIIKGRYTFSAPSHYLPIIEPQKPLY